MLRRQPAFSAAALLTLAVGIGATTAVFSVAHATLFRRLPFRKPDRLMMLYLTPPPSGDARPAMGDVPWSYPKLRALRRLNDGFEEVAAYSAESFTLTGAGVAERVEAEYVSSNYFRVLGATARLGRVFSAEEDAAPGTHRVAIIGEALWRRRFSADPAVAGRSLRLGEDTFTVIGVMPAAFAGLSGKSELWVPTMCYPAEMLDEPFSHWLDAVARVKPGLTIAQAQSRTGAIGEAIDREIPATRFGKGRWGARAVPIDDLRVPPAARRSILVLMAAVGFLLLIGCANLANLQLARGTARGREIAVRLALGASQRRVVRHLLAESLLLALAGGALGIGFAAAGLRLIEAAALATGADGRNRLAGFTAQLFDGVGVDGAALGFTIAASVATGLLFGLVPAWQASRTDLVQPLKAGGAVAGGTLRIRGRSLLVAAELALAVVLLSAAGLMARSFAKLQAIDPGFSADHVVTMRVDLPPWRYTGEARTAAVARLLDRVRAVPGVTAAGANNCTPLSGACNGTAIWFEGEPPATSPDDQPAIGIHFADGGYFRALQIPVVRGRLFSPGDRAGAPRVVVINESAARTFWPGKEALGRRVRVGQGNFTPAGTWAEVVGVVGDVRYGALERAARPDVYVPIMQAGRSSAFVFARAVRSPSVVAGAIASAIRQFDPELPIYSIRTMSERAAGATARPRLTSVLLGFFACAALALAAVGTYGVMAFAVFHRTREIGVRMALGASRPAVLRAVLMQGLFIAGAGVLAGLVFARAAARVLDALLFDIEPDDPATLAISTVFLLIVAAAACLPAALRASRVDPIVALRCE